MADLYTRPERPRRPTRADFRRGLTPSQAELLPYLQQAQVEEQTKAQKIRPLQAIFDLLQRGQYLTANVAKQIIESARTHEPLGQAAADAISAAYRGLSGQEKGDWESVLFGGTDTGAQEFGGLFGDIPGFRSPLIKLKGKTAEGEQRGILRPRKIIGLLANIALDPLTYFGGVGPSTKARSVASTFADDIVRFGSGKIDEIAKLAKAPVKARSATVEGLAELTKHLRDKNQTQLLKRLNDVVKEAGQYAMGHTPQELAERMGREYAQRIGLEVTGPTDLATVQRWVYEDLAPGIAEGADLAGRYKGAGERAARIFGKEFFRGERAPWFGERAVQTIKEYVGKSPAGPVLEQAWWSVMNSPYSPVGVIRKALGIRNPYEKLLNLKHLRMADTEIDDMIAAAEGSQMFNKVTPDIEKKFVAVMEETRRLRKAEEVAGRKAGAVAAYAGAQKQIAGAVADEDTLFQRVLQTYDMPMEQKTDVLELHRQWKASMDRIRAEEQVGVAKGILKDFGYIEEYLPGIVEGRGGTRISRVLGSPSPWFTKAKKTGMVGHTQEAVERIKAFWGDDLDKLATQYGLSADEVAQRLASEGVMSDVATSLKDMFVARQIAHAKAMKRVRLIEQFREFGIDDEVVRMMSPRPQDVGLRQIQDEALSGLWFDAEIAEILDRATVASGARESKGLFRAMSAYTTWWKSVVTTTTGFHFRNLWSGSLTGFLKHGPRWFRFRKYTEPALAATLYAVYPQNYMDMASKTFKKPGGWMQSNLAKRFGDFNTQELADYLRSTGLVSTRTHGFEAAGSQTLMRTVAEKYSPLSTKNVAFEASRHVGNIVENVPKVQSFLMDYEQMFREGVETAGTLAERVAANKSMLDWANLEGKKWWIDYGNLSEWEKKYLKPVIPFYTWLRSNIANQLSGVLTYPDMYAMVAKASEAAETDEGFDFGLMPDWMREQGMVPISRDPETGNWILFRPDFAYRDLNLIPLSWDPGAVVPGIDQKEILADILGNAHPVVKTIVELAPQRGWNFFRRREIKKEETAPAVFQYLAKSPKVLQFLDGMMRMMGRPEGIRVDMMRDANQVVMDGKTAEFLTLNLPVLNTLGTVLEGFETGAFQLGAQDIEDWIENRTGKRDYYTDLEDLFRFLTQWWGVKFSGINLADQEQQRAERVYGRGQQMRSDVYRTTSEYQQRSTEYRRRREADLRKLGLMQ